MVAEYEKENLYDLEFQIWEVVVGEQLSANLPWTMASNAFISVYAREYQLSAHKFDRNLNWEKWRF